MPTPSITASPPAVPPQTSSPSAWRNLVAAYQTPQAKKSLWQLFNTIVPYFILWYLMILSLDVGYWLVLLLSLPAAGLQIRIFIFQHDCGHGSFFKSRKANDWVGMACSLITWTPYFYWQKSHAIHHANASNLEQRGIGDIYTMTVKEYQEKPWWGKLQYRIYRNPFFLFGVVPTLLFGILYRLPSSQTKSMKRVRSSLYWTNLALALLVGGLIWLIGLKAYLMVFLPIFVISSSIGTWMFYVQHQFEDTYWDSGDSWDYSLAALQGSSYYKLPKVLQWFTGNIGFHHIHHLSPRIPNYLLEQCHEENPLFQETVVLTLGSSLKSVFLSLWDEEQKKLISFGQFKQRRLETSNTP